MAVLLIVLLTTITSVTIVSAGTGTALPAPVIYGDFNTNVIEGAGSCPLTETGTGTGIFTGIYAFTAYTGAGDGYSLFACTSKILDGANWVPADYYTMAGVVGTPTSTSYFKPTVTGNYEVTYTAATHVTTIYQVVNFTTPVIYGDFNSWKIEGTGSCPLTETGTGTGVFKGTYSFTAYTGTGAGYYLFSCLSKKDSAYGWGAYEQYKMDGTAAGFAGTSFFKPTVTGNYEVTYTAATHVTTAELVETDLAKPVIYGDFNGWLIEGAGSLPLTETAAGTGIYKAIIDFTKYTGTGNGYTLITCVTKKNYGTYGWGAGLQYKMNGEVAGMGATSYFKPTVTGKYEVTYNAATHITTAVYQSPKTSDSGTPWIYITGMAVAAIIALAGIAMTQKKANN